MTKSSSEKILKRAAEVLDVEISGLREVRESLDGGFTDLVSGCVKILDAGGKIVLSGVGKSGHIGRKIAATLSSVGSTAVFMHPVEAMHGDLGVLKAEDILITLSYSGETEELLAILPAARRMTVPIAAITGPGDSPLSGLSDIVVQMPVSREACPFNLAPTSTTTAMLALGDALAMVLLDLRSFTKDDYGKLHPAGAIGRTMTLRIKDIMRKGDRIAVVGRGTSVKDTLISMTRARCGSAAVTDSRDRILGIFTDGDFRRYAENDMGILDRKVSDVMTENPSTLNEDDLAVDALRMIEKKHIDDIIVTNSRSRVVGLVDIQDLPGLKLM